MYNSHKQLNTGHMYHICMRSYESQNVICRGHAVGHGPRSPAKQKMLTSSTDSVAPTAALKPCYCHSALRGSISPLRSVPKLRGLGACLGRAVSRYLFISTESESKVMLLLCLVSRHHDRESGAFRRCTLSCRPKMRVFFTSLLQTMLHVHVQKKKSGGPPDRRTIRHLSYMINPSKA